MDTTSQFPEDYFSSPDNWTTLYDNATEHVQLRNSVEYYIAVCLLVAFSVGTLVTNSIVLSALLFCGSRRRLKGPADMFVLSMTFVDLLLLVPMGFSLYDVVQDLTAVASTDRCLFVCWLDYGLQITTVLHLCVINGQRYKGTVDVSWSTGSRTTRAGAGVAIAFCWLMGLVFLICFASFANQARYSYWEMACVIAADGYSESLTALVIFDLLISALSIVAILLSTFKLMWIVRQTVPPAERSDAMAIMNMSPGIQGSSSGASASTGSPQAGQGGPRPRNTATNKGQGADTTKKGKNRRKPDSKGSGQNQPTTPGQQNKQAYRGTDQRQSQEKSRMKLWVVFSSIVAFAILCFAPRVWFNLQRLLQHDFRPQSYFAFVGRFLFYFVGVLNPIHNGLLWRRLVRQVASCTCCYCRLLGGMCNVCVGIH